MEFSAGGGAAIMPVATPDGGHWGNGHMQRNKPTGLDPDLVTAYRATDYHVTGAVPQFVMHVDEPSEALAALHAARGATCSALLTACNPASRAMDDDVNAAAQRQLAERLAADGVEWVEALGADPLGRWPAEPSVLALGLDCEAAILLAREFGQNALLWAGANAVPRLLLLR
jgi:hypothetical protein